MDEPRFITVEEFCIKFRTTRETIHKMMKDGRVQGIYVGRHANRGRLMLVDPGQRFARYLEELDERLAHVPLINTREAAELIGIHQVHLRTQLCKGKIKAQRQNGKECLFTVAEVRRYISKQEKLKRPGRRIVKLETVLRWARDLVDKHRRETNQGVMAEDELVQTVDEIMALPEPRRTVSLTEFLGKLDRVEMIRMVLDRSTAKNQQNGCDSTEVAHANTESLSAAPPAQTTPIGSED